MRGFAEASSGTREWDPGKVSQGTCPFDSVANDQTAPVIDLFFDGMYDEQEAIRRLLPQKLKDQYTFKTPKAIRLLHCKEVLRL